MARPSAIVPLSAQVDWVRWCLYGDPGVGKTALTGTNVEPMLYLKSKSDTIASAKIISHSTADVWELSCWQDAEEANDYLRLGSHGYKWWNLDTITLFQDLGLQDIMEDLVAHRPHRQVWLPDKGEYGQNMNRIMKLLRDLCTLPMHGIVTAHAFHDLDSDGNERIMPFVQGKNMPDKVCGLMNLVTYMKANGERRQLFTAKQELIYAKDGFSALPAIIDKPTMPAMLARIRSKVPVPPGKKVGAPVGKTAVPAKKTAAVPAAKKAAVPVKKAATVGKVAPAAAPAKKATAAAPAKKAATPAAKATKTTKKGTTK